MKKSILLLATSLLAMTQTFSQKKYPDVDIPYKQYTLDNGLKLIVHEDHKAPIVSFNVWYHVGSKNEKPGKTGFAHLYEHLMFNGSEHYNDDYFKLMDAIGATDLNGTTNNDRTNYFENVPISVLDKVLWIESDRMGFMLKAIDSARLAEQRGVVQNEKREGDNQPYSVLEELTVKATYPASHPYSWTVIGSMADLDAASLDDVKDWFKTYYGPNNAVVVISGDVKADDIFEKVKKYFGEIPAGPPIAHHKDWIAKMTGRSFQVVEDRVPQARLQKVWNVPGWGSEELTRLNMLGDILTTGKSSRLYKRLVYDEQLASSVNFYTDEKEIGGQFYITADAKPGVELEKIEGIINQELKKIITSGITAQELERAKSRYFAGFVKGIERIGGFGGKSDILAMSATYKGSPDYYKQINKMVANATEADLKKVAGDWLSDGEFVAYVLPFGEYAASDKPVDRSKMPDATKDPEVVFPAIKEFSLSNGLKVSLVERKSVPVVNMNLMVNAGFSSDQFAVPGVASLAGRMMMEGTQTKSSIQISDLLADLGAGMSVNSSQDFTTMSMNTLKSNIGGAMELFTDVLFNPSFPQKDFDRVQKQQLLRIKNEQTQPVYMGLRILPRLLYGNGHAYMNPYTGTGFEETVKKITVADLKKFHQDWFAPNNAQLLVVGDITEAELKPMLEARLGAWKNKTVPMKNVSPVKIPAAQSVYIIDKPGAMQSIIFAAQLTPSATDPGFEAIKMMNTILGGEFTSRINMNLREDKHWSYGSFTFMPETVGQGFITAYAPVQTDKTKESVIELQKEINAYVGDKQATEAEFKKAQTNAVLQLPGIWETNGAVMGTLQSARQFNRSKTYLDQYANMLRGLSLNDVRAAATRVIQPTGLTWVIVGDKAKIEQGIRDLNIGTVKLIDSEGKEMK